MNILTLLSVYLFVGFWQAFGFWIVAGDDDKERLSIGDYFMVVALWPYFWAMLMPDLKILPQLVKDNKWLFLKILMTNIAIAILIVKVVT